MTWRLGMARPDPSDRSQWSVVIPVLQEAQQLPSLLAQLQGPEEVWVVDGGSRDGSGQIARLMGAHWLRSAPSRGAQLRLGAAQATRPWLLFLHADARLPSHWASVLAAALRDPAVAAAAFHLRVNGRGWKLRLLEQLVDWRCRCRGLPYGDQGLALAADVYKRSGGYRSIPLMEDLELVQRLHGYGRVVLASGAVKVSARRWQRLGVWRSSWRNVQLRRAWRQGVPIDELAGRY